MTLISQKYIDDNNLVARYLADRLSNEERESFEAYYLEHPKLLQELNVAAQFKSGLIELHERGELDEVLIRQSHWKRSNSFAIAASIALAAVGAILLVNRDEASPILAASVTALGAEFETKVQRMDSYEIQRTRSISYDATIGVSSKAAAIELRIKPEQAAALTRYRVRISTISTNGVTTEVAAADNLQSAKDGFVTVYLNPSRLSPMIYELTIYSDMLDEDTKSASSFLIELINAAGESK